MLPSMLPSRVLIALVASLGGLFIILAFTAPAPASVTLIAAGLTIALLALLGVDVYLSISGWRRAASPQPKRRPPPVRSGSRRRRATCPTTPCF